MLVKPDACRGCPLYGDGKGYVPDEVIPGAAVFILGQNPGQEEEREGRPFVGKTGEEMTGTYLPLAGLQRGDNVSIGNTLRCRWIGPDGKRTNKLPTGRVLAQAVEHCTKAHLRIPPETRLLVAQGALAWGLLGRGVGSISDWRGFLAPQPYPVPTHDEGCATIPVFGVLHLADLWRDQRMTLPSQMDWLKIPKILKGAWPRPLPAYVLATTHAFASAEQWFDEAEQAPWVVIDTEYERDSKYLFLIGLGYRSMDHSLLFDWRMDHEHWFRSWFIGRLRRLVATTPVVFQNSMADIPVLEKNIGIGYADYKQIEDTMLAHAVLWSELPHELEFLASVYGQYPKLKHLMKEDLYLYNHGDILATDDAWAALRKELEGDIRTEILYRQQSLKLIPIILERTKKGIRVNQARVLPALAEYEGKLAEASRLARAWVGRPFNLGSDQQVARYCYQTMGYPLQKNKDTKRPTVDADAISVLRGMVDPVPDLDEEEKHGLSIDTAHARVLAGGDPILEARVIYASAQQAKSHFLEPLLIWNRHDKKGKPVKKYGWKGVHERIYPNQKIHAQASGRWSTTVFD